jgi:hypothetical protein
VIRTGTYGARRGPFEICSQAGTAAWRRSKPLSASHPPTWRGSPAGGLKQILQRHSFILRRLPPKDFRYDHRRSPDVLGRKDFSRIGLQGQSYAASQRRARDEARLLGVIARFATGTMIRPALSRRATTFSGFRVSEGAPVGKGRRSHDSAEMFPQHGCGSESYCGGDLLDREAGCFQ